MAELKKMTVQALRELARKALGRGHSRFKTKRELIEALQAAEKKVAGAAERAAARLKQATDSVRSERPISKSVKPVAGSAPKAQPLAVGRKGAKRAGEKGKLARPRARPGAKPMEPAREEGAPLEPAGEAAAPRRREVAAETEPDPEGYMVARVAGEEALRGAPHPFTESALDSERKAPPPSPPAAGVDEVLGELPWTYGDDVLVALPRDPTTLFLYWDHAPETLRQAWAGLEGGRPQLWLFVREIGGEWVRARTIEFALESRSYYVHDLASGRSYRAEIHVVDGTGRDALVARPSNEIQLPSVGPSSIVDDRFMLLPWSEPLQLLREAHPGGPFSEDLRAQLGRLSDWSRFEGRAWGGWGGSAGGMGGRPFSPVSSPSSPAGAFGRPGGKGR